MLLLGNPKLSDNVNSDIIYAIIKFIESTKRFSGSLYYYYNSKYFFPFYFLSLIYFLS